LIRWQGHGRQYSDDRYNYHQLYQGKTLLNFLFHDLPLEKSPSNRTWFSL
jgi:hypothetical protein